MNVFLVLAQHTGLDIYSAICMYDPTHGQIIMMLNDTGKYLLLLVE